MKALSKSVAGPGLTLRDRAIPTLGENDVLIAPTYAGICGTDHHIYEWDEWSAQTVPIGIAVGHEFVGHVAAVGAAVTGFRVGQRVCGEGHIGCGLCRECQNERSHFCAKVQVIGVNLDGCFAQYIRLPERNVWPIDDRIPDVIAAVMDPIGNAVHTVSAAQVQGAHVLITGAGVIGLIATGVAVAYGARSVTVVDLEVGHLEQATAMGASAVVDAREPDWMETVKRHSGGEGPDVLIEMSGAASAITKGLALVRHGGTAALLGIPAQPLTLDLASLVIFKGLQVIGITGREVYKTWRQAEELLVSGQLRLDAIDFKILPMVDFEQAFDHASTARSTKVLLTVGLENS
jgi:threonine 3-dehydrogenase